MTERNTTPNHAWYVVYGERRCCVFNDAETQKIQWVDRGISVSTASIVNNHPLAWWNHRKEKAKRNRQLVKEGRARGLSWGEIDHITWFTEVPVEYLEKDPTA